jgi:pilus assembly protein CpaE
MKLDYFILSGKLMYANAIKEQLDALNKPSKVFSIVSDLKEGIEVSNDTVVFISSIVTHDPYDLCMEITHTNSSISVVLVLPREEIDYKKAMFSGAVDIIATDSEEHEIQSAILAAEKLLFMKEELTTDHVDKEKDGKVITVCSTKGGVGKTTVSVNTATALVKQNYKVAIIDLDLQFGDVSILFDIQPKKTIYEWVKEAYESGNQSLDGYLNTHNTGIDILSAPNLPEFAELITGEHLLSIITALKKKYDYIIIDTPPSFVETSLVALENSDCILSISTLDLPSLKNGKLAIDTLAILGLKEKIRIILNRDAEMKGMTTDLVEGVLGMKVFARIPSDYQTVITSINRGIPFVLGAPRTDISKAFVSLSEKLYENSKPLDVSEPKRKKKRFLQFRFK